MQDFTPPGTPTRDDPDVVAAMSVYDNLNDTGRREVFRSTYRAVLAWLRTGDAGHLSHYAAAVDGMVVSEVRNPGLREILRNAPKTVAEAGGSVPVEAALAVLRGTMPVAVAKGMADER